MITFEEAYDKIRPGEQMFYGLKTRDRCRDHWDLAGGVMSLRGDLIEVGVWRGGTAALAAAQMKNLGDESTLFLCDTWSGVPREKTCEKDLYVGGEHRDSDTKVVVDLFSRVFDFDSLEVILLPGIFPDETKRFVEGRQFKYVSLDVDVYESTKQCFEFLWPSVVRGGVVIIDDYKWPNTPGVEEFVDEMLASKKYDLEIVKQSTKYQFSCVKK